ncbi:hypothetical protein SEA_LARRYKAY_94 [Mycobacterium phage LarryKay]|nr:hypothetical protein SEA_LARRYKAY_94 [Mycobacterium phage LarryKay]
MGAVNKVDIADTEAPRVVNRSSMLIGTATGIARPTDIVGPGRI